MYSNSTLESHDPPKQVQCIKLNDPVAQQPLGDWDSLLHCGNLASGQFYKV